MTLPLDAFLPSLAVLGLWSYWALGLAAFLEAFVPTGLFMPGTLIVEAGGILVQQGLLDYLDLVWFVAAGAILGGEASYSLGRLARRIPGEAILAWMPLIAMEACRDLRRRVFGCLAAAPAGRRPAACGGPGGADLCLCGNRPGRIAACAAIRFSERLRAQRCAA